MVTANNELTKLYRAIDRESKMCVHKNGVLRCIMFRTLSPVTRLVYYMPISPGHAIFGSF